MNPTARGPSSSRVLTVPNGISAARIALIPVFVALIVDHDTTTAGLVLFAVVVATDWVDGTIARRTGQVSDVGKILDPVADRLLFFVGITAIVVDGSCPLWFAIVALVREVIVAGATLTLAALGARRIDVTWFGKAGTCGLMLAFPLFLTSHSTISWHELAGVLAWVTGIPGLIFSYIAAGLYVPIGLRALREGRMARRVRTAS
jgi:cardiolipin synthase